MKIAVLVSGEAPELKALVDAKNDGLFLGQTVDIDLVVSSNEEAPALQDAQKLGLQTMALSSIIFDADPQVADEIIAAELKSRQVDYVLLCGYEKDVHEALALSFKDRIIRVHPSLLPAFPGPHALEDVWISGVKVSGASIHFVNEFGQASLIAQDSFKIPEGASLTEITQTTQELINTMLPEVVRLLSLDLVRLKADKTVAILPESPRALRLRWRCAKKDLALKKRHFANLKYYGLPDPLISWMIQHLEWTLPEALSSHNDALLCVEVAQDSKAAMDLLPYKAFSEQDLSAKRLNMFAKTTGTSPKDGIDSEVFWTLEDGQASCWTTSANPLSAANQLCKELLEQKGISCCIKNKELADDELGELCKAGMKAGDKANAKVEPQAKSFECFLVSDEHGVVPSSEHKAQWASFLEECWSKLLS